MVTSLEQLFEHYSINDEDKNRMAHVYMPKQKDFVSLVQYFGNAKMLKLNLNEWNKNHRLIPYGNNIYGIYEQAGYDLYDSRGNLNSTFEGNREDCGNPIMIVKFNVEVYKQTKEEYNRFWEWRNNRNPIRMAMEEEFNFDGKHAMHLVRLLRMGEEVLTTGQIIVKRPDADELLGIRNGSMTYEEIVEYAEDMDNNIKKNLLKNTDLPKNVNLIKASNILMNAQEMVWSNDA